MLHFLLVSQLQYNIAQSTECFIVSTKVKVVSVFVLYKERLGRPPLKTYLYRSAHSFWRVFEKSHKKTIFSETRYRQSYRSQNCRWLFSRFHFFYSCWHAPTGRRSATSERYYSVRHGRPIIVEAPMKMRTNVKSIVYRERILIVHRENIVLVQFFVPEATPLSVQSWIITAEQMGTRQKIVMKPVRTGMDVQLQVSIAGLVSQSVSMERVQVPPLLQLLHHRHLQRCRWLLLLHSHHPPPQLSTTVAGRWQRQVNAPPRVTLITAAVAGRDKVVFRFPHVPRQRLHRQQHLHW